MIRRLFVLIATAIVATSTLAACGSTSLPPVDLGPLTDGFHSGDFSKVTFADMTSTKAANTYQAIVKGMLGVKPKVTAGAPTITKGDDKTVASASLHWVWPFKQGSLQYDTTVHLVPDGKTWDVVWEPTMVEGDLKTATAHLEADRVKSAASGRILAQDGTVLVGSDGKPKMAKELLTALSTRDADTLEGTPGLTVAVKDTGQQDTVLTQVPPGKGTDITVSLDPHMQSLADGLLAHVKPASALVAIRVSTGQVVAAANGPGNNGYNIATYGQAPSGSTFKSIDSLALFRQGLTPETKVPCTTSIIVDGKKFENDSFYPKSALGKVPWKTVVANSCNTGTISQHDKVTGDNLQDAAASLGFGVDYNVGFPAYFGQIPNPASEVEKAADMIGQGKVLASPLAMATVMATIQGGTLRIPSLVAGTTAEPKSSIAPLTADEDKQLKTVLREVVLSGTGTGLKDIPGPPIIAKTGTAEFVRGGKTLTHAWMMAAQGDLAVAVYVDTGETGAGTAGPILEAFLRGAL